MLCCRCVKIRYKTVSLTLGLVLFNVFVIHILFMSMQKNAFMVGLVLLVVGLGVGYGFGVGKSTVRPTTRNTHMMSDGEKMHDDDRAMSMSAMMMDMNAELRGKTGDAFDRAFLSEMIIHHEGAVQMAEQALSYAKHQEIKDLATAIISAQNKEVASMKSWQKTWYNQ